MNSPSEKDYLDAKLQAFVEQVNGEARARQVTVDARFDRLEQAIDFGFRSLRDEFDLKLANLENKFLLAQKELIKWIVGAMITSTTISITTTAVMINYAIPRPVVTPSVLPVPATQGDRHGMGAVPRVELLQDGFHVRLDGVLA
ncbi:hypothetical protein GJ699_30295 [Duganella sp. FT80W]|uniref:DUF1640 domain-containing protein n=1 Tax=Duganella guangzhouensis TaxID=2666084 RepID=A0A6I2LBU5_9BURK|nr:hypothetical protein [Duganella guangzhouensis]MRW94274.1 hypothetical protein [Duganella guangzhouensis]